MALHHQDVELALPGRSEPVWLKERNGGRDFEAVHEARVSRRTANAEDAQ